MSVMFPPARFDASRWDVPGHANWEGGVGEEQVLGASSDSLPIFDFLHLTSSLELCIDIFPLLYTILKSAAPSNPWILEYHSLHDYS